MTIGAIKIPLGSYILSKNNEGVIFNLYKDNALLIFLNRLFKWLKLIKKLEGDDVKMVYTLLRGYVVKNFKKFLIMIFAIAVSTTIIFGSMVARISQSKYTMDEIYRQSPSYQIEVGNMGPKDFETIKKDDNIKSFIVKKYFGQVTQYNKLYFLEEFNNDAFKKLKHTLLNGQFPEKKDEIIISDDLFKSLKSDGKITSVDSNSNEYYVDLRYTKDFINNNDEHEMIDKTHKFKIVGTYNMTETMDLVLDGQGIYVYNDFEYPRELVTYNGLIDLKTGFKNVQERIDELSLRLDSGQLNMQTNRALDMAISENQDASSSFNMFDTGIIIASAFIIFNVFNIMMKEMISEIGLMRVVGMSKNQSLAIFILKDLLVLIVGSLIGFFGGYLLAEAMIKYIHLTGNSIDSSNAPIYISSYIISKTLMVTVSILIVSTIVPIVTTLKSYPVSMMSGKLRSPFNVADDILDKLKIYRKFKLFFLNKKKNKHKSKRFKFKTNNMRANIAISNSKRNAVYILSTGAVVGMAGLYGVMQFITTDDGTNIGDTRLQRLADYDIDLNYTGISNSKDTGISQEDMKKINSIKGIGNIYTFATEFGYTKLNTSDLSESFRKSFSIDNKDKEQEMKFDIIGLNNESLHNLESNHKGIIESGRIYQKNDEVVEAVVYNNYFDQGYSGDQQKFSEKLKLGDILTIKVPAEINGKLQYKSIKIKIVGFLSPEWFTVGSYTLSAVPDILIDSNEYAKITNNSNFSQVKIKANKSDLSDVQTQVKNIFKNNKYIKYEDKNTMENEANEFAWEVALRNISNSAMLTITAIINIIFSIVTSIAIRKREFGVMRSIGFSIKDLKGILIFEGLIYGLASSIIGFLLIFHKGVSWANLNRTVARLQHVPYDGTWYILPKIPILIFIVITIVTCLLSVTFTFGKLNKDSIVSQIREE